jgi:hypothetical protein
MPTRKEGRGRMLSVAPAPAGVQPVAAAADLNQRVNNTVSRHSDKSTLPLSEPRRYLDRVHLKFVAWPVNCSVGRV